MEYTYGLEIEAVDFDRREINLPEGCKWAHKEVTLVNSNGLAVDSTKKSKNFLGGEINTRPTKGLDEQVKLADKCFFLLKKQGATINYRCNIQSHVGGIYPEDDEKETLNRLKKIQKYAFDNYDKLLMLTMGKGQFEKKPEYPVAFWSHYKERMLPEWKHKFLLEAKTLDEFRKAMFFSREGKFSPMTFARQGINLHSFYKTRTLEFRIFWATLETKHVQDILYFSKLFVDDALGKQTHFNDLVEYFKGKFPKEQKFSLELEKSFQATKVAKPS